LANELIQFSTGRNGQWAHEMFHILSHKVNANQNNTLIRAAAIKKTNNTSVGEDAGE
jgi:hypothetical protein